MFANSQGPLPAMGFAFPDVLLLPPFEIPVPFPNISLCYCAIPTCFNVFYMCMPAHNELTMRLPTIDGIGIGVASGTDMGPGRDLIGSTNYFVDCMPQTKMTMPVLNNLTNAPGIGLTPAQIVVLTLS
jgi:hypothetical protein